MLVCTVIVGGSFIFYKCAKRKLRKASLPFSVILSLCVTQFQVNNSVVQNTSL